MSVKKKKKQKKTRRYVAEILREIPYRPCGTGDKAFSKHPKNSSLVCVATSRCVNLYMARHFVQR